MGSIYKPSYPTKDRKTGKKILKRLSRWYCEYKDADGITRRRAGFRDKESTRALLYQLERQAAREASGLVDPQRAVAMGRLLGANYFILTDITSYEARAHFKHFPYIKRWKRVGLTEIVVRQVGPG